MFLDGGLRLSELAGLQVADVDLRDRIVFVAGKAGRRSGPRHRAVALGVKAARALDRYLRERRRHPYLGPRLRAAGGNEGDLMLLGGWRSRAMLDRYGKAAAADRAADGYRRLSFVWAERREL